MPGLACAYRAIASRLPGRIRVPFLHWKATGRWPSLSPPQTFNEKMCWRKVHPPRDPAQRALLVQTCDKIGVRDYVAQQIGAEFLTDHFYHAAHSRELPFEQMPARFAVKANHASTFNYFVQDKATEDWAALHARCEQWLERGWGRFAGEWWYGEVKPRILMEEFLEDENGQSPSDYKFFVSRGAVQMIQVDFDRFAGHKRNLYRPNWSLIPCRYLYPTGPSVPRPRHLEQMLEVASMLGTPFDFARVDLYLIGDRILFGEITHCPESGWGKFSDPAIDLWLGEQIELFV